MKTVIEKYSCDICKKEAKVTAIKYPVIFDTEQDEGRSCEPYISNQVIDVCDDCKKQILVIHASGAQGFNNYRIKKEERTNE
jgi:hypothetical protein